MLDNADLKRKKSLISNMNFSNLKNDFLKICLLEMVILNLISKKPWDLPGDPPPPPTQHKGTSKLGFDELCYGMMNIRLLKAKRAQSVPMVFQCSILKCY